MWLATVLLTSFITLAFGTITMLAMRNCSRSGNIRRQIDSALKQIGAGEQIPAEVTAVLNPSEKLGAHCEYELCFSGKEGLARRIIMPMQLDLGNRLTIGDQVLLRAANVPVLPLLESAVPQNPKQQKALPMRGYPTDATGTVLLESDFFAVRDKLLSARRQCIAQIAGNAVGACVSLFLTLINLIITLGGLMM